jgi:Fe-S-cluster containining protein
MKESAVTDEGIPVGQFILFPSNLSNSPCEMCGKCCKNNWSIELSEEEFLRYKTILKNSDLPEEYESFSEEIQQDGETIYKLLLRNSGCIFILDDNRCYIHSRYGPESKSRACRYFPLEVSGYSPRGMHLKTSFACPSILRSLLSSEGVTITRVDWKNNLRCASHLIFHGGYTITWERLFSLSDAMSCLFVQNSFDVEQKLLIAGKWINDMYEAYKLGNSAMIDVMSGREYLLDHKQSFLDECEQLSPLYAEKMNLMSHIAHVMSMSAFISETEVAGSCENTGILKSKEMIANVRNRLQEVYHDIYLKELQKFSKIIAKYILHKLQSMGIFTQKGFIYGVNHLILCYAFFRMFLLTQLISEKKTIISADVIEAVTFVEENFFHRKSAKYLTSPQMAKILSNPNLFHFLLKL